MGRLTLNILLSFAQFEREVIGERIRDKFALSRRKGMWMGGCPPLGYDVVVLVIDWRSKQMARGAVRQMIEVVFDEGLPEIYDEALYDAKCAATFAHIFSSYAGGGESVYVGA